MELEHRGPEGPCPWGWAALGQQHLKNIPTIYHQCSLQALWVCYCTGWASMELRSGGRGGVLAPDLWVMGLPQQRL